MKRIITIILSSILCCMCIPAYSYAIKIEQITVENSTELWERFLKYDLCVLDYDSLTDEQKELCRFIFETELNSEDTIICERARRTLVGYDVGERVTLEDTENYYDFADYAHMYSEVVNSNAYQYMYLNSVPDIKHIDYDVNYNEYWLDDTGSKKILSTGERDFGIISDTYTYIEQNSGEITLSDDIERPVSEFETITDDNFTYVIYPDNTLYVLKANEHMKSYEIPAEFNGMKVVGIKSRAFDREGCYDIILPESIEYIEPYAFAECTLLKSVTLSKNLKFLGTEAFIDCTSLKNIIVDCPDLFCKTAVFGYCNAENVFLNFKCIPSCMISSFDNIDNLIFGDDVIKMGALFANSKFMKNYSYSIPETVKFITNDIFEIYNDYYSEDLVIPETVKVFGSYRTPAIGKYQYNLISGDACIAVIDNKCYLSPDTVISGYYGTEAYNYSIVNNLTFNPLDTEISGYYGTEAHNYAISHNIKFNPLDDINYGDSNKDGEINIADAVSLSKYLFGTGTVGYEADLTKDGKIDVFDMILMRKAILDNQ